LREGGAIRQETRLWNEREGRTYVMRSKEEAHDYRYFPEPDLPPLMVTESWLENLRHQLPELPEARRQRFQDSYGLTMEESMLLTQSREMADYYEQATRASESPKLAANWMLSELLRELKNANIDIAKCPIKPADLGALIKLINNNTISGKIAKEVFEKMFQSGTAPQEIIRELGLEQISDAGQIKDVVSRVLTENPKQVENYCQGKQSLLGFFVGQIMKATSGKANPQMVNEILKQMLDERCKS
jgi:aspartyl-tRNA(Asn)/glutamyl-tRNA(Gln) amidotransferase subunit B